MTVTAAPEKKIKVFTLSDHPLSPSGVGTQTKYVIEALLRTGRYQIISFGGAIKHDDYTPVKTEEYGDDWVIYPVDGYGNPEMVRSLVRNERPDVLWFMTDPRFWGWLWEIEHEIRALVPMVYYHVWDNIPYPKFNAPNYESNDYIFTISKVTDDIVKNVSPTVNSEYFPHAVDVDIFKKYSDEEIKNFRTNSMGPDNNKMLFFWNNRNARRKQSGTLIWWFKEFLDKVGHDKAALIMHTDVKDSNGQDLEAIINELGLVDGQVLFSQAKVPPENLARIYGMVDCTINISDAEGFGLATLESLSCETPIIVTMTGGLQEQVTDGKEFFGFGLEPTSRSVIGSQEVPYIYEDRIAKEDFLDAMVQFYNMTAAHRAKLGKKGRAHVKKNYNFETFGERWAETIDRIHKESGSWETRKNFKSWTLREIA
jgi:glycosyltransferase involved in cell wall biosynthesis